MLEKTIPKSLKSFIEDELYGKSKSPLKYHKRSASKSIDSNGGKYLNNQILKVENLKCTSSYTIKLDILNEEDKSLSSTIKTESKKISDFFKMNSTHNKSVSYRSHENDIIQNIPSESECEKINENVSSLKIVTNP